MNTASVMLDPRYTQDSRSPIARAKPRRRGVNTPVSRRISVDAASVVQVIDFAAYYSPGVATATPDRASAKEAEIMSEAELREIVYRYARRGVQFVASGMLTISALAGLGHLPGWDALAYGLGGFIMMGWSFLLTPQSPLGRLFSGRKLPA